jgi:hypothetical protein
MTIETNYAHFLNLTGSPEAAATLVLAASQREPQRTVMTPPQVAKQLGADPATVINWIRGGQLKASNLANGHRPRYVIQIADLDAFLSSRQPDLRQRKIA